MVSDPVSEQLEALPVEQRAVLAPYWARAAELVPEADPALSYGMPALKYRGLGLVSLMPTKKGFSVYPYGNAPVSEILERHPGYEHTKGSIHFTASEPLAMDAFDDLIRTRVRHIDERKNG